MATAARMKGNLDEDFERDIQALIRQQQQSRGIFDLDRDELNIYRSGSAPPTVEGSRTALGNFFGSGGLANAPAFNGRNAGPSLTEEEMTSHPAYLSYYYSNENLNPRMPPPAVSKEDWRARQRFHSGTALFGKIGDPSEVYVEGDASSLFSVQPGGRELLQENVPQRHSGEWLDTDGLIGLPDVGLGSRRKSFADALQEELSRPTSAIGNISRPVSRNTYDNVDPRAPGSQLIQLHNGSEALGDLQTGATSSGLVRVRSIGSSISHSFASSLGSSLARSTTPDAHLIRRTPSPCLPPIGVRSSDSNNHSTVSSNRLEGASAHMANSSDILAAMSGLSLSKSVVLDEDIVVQQRKKQELFDQPDLMFNMPSDQRQALQSKILNSDIEPLRTSANHFTGYIDISNKSDGFVDASLAKSISNGQSNLQNQSSYANIYRKMSSEGTTSQRHNSDIASIAFSNLKHESYTGNQGPPIMLNNQLDSEGLYLNANQLGYNLQLPTMDSLYTQYLRGTSDSVLHGAASLDPSLGKNHFNDSHLDFPGYQNPYLGSLGPQNKLQYHVPFLNKSDGLNHRFYTNDVVGMSYPANQMSSSIHSPLGRGSPARQNERSSRAHTIVQSGRESVGTWSSKNGVMEEGYLSSLLEEFKSNKSRSFELSDIVGHVVEFSADQFGSRFIQQKLESASVEEKNEIFPEIIPKAHALMTDVFGNYVIQKLFEHGTEEQRKQLASQLTGHVLQLSLQMYGCRVIQKALEVVDVDQQTQMVLELDGHIMKCVRDQNGNHVIQKCIERVPQEKIQLIIEAFYGHVVSLSTHPYGCRVIQRVLEHCNDPKTQSIMMGEIMQSVCALAQDQYGNYVIQHVLQHGKPEERTAIIIKLCGQIVEMSQQKYASNVIEKCLSYGTPEERQLLINEMLGSTDENEPLQAMMKDQFANYVVQKVIETCDDQNRELILSRVKVHLTTLKRYTYGKHIVARVEKLVAAGEKRIGVSTCSS